MINDPFFKFGASAAAAFLGKSAAEFRAAEGETEVLDSPTAAPHHIALCKIAAAAYAINGDRRSPAALLFQRLAETPEWEPGCEVFTDSIKRAMAKQATLLPLLAGAHDKLGGKMIKSLVAFGALGGAGLGSLGFILSRNARQSSAENSEILQKVRAYRQLARDIQEDMEDTQMLPAKKKGPARYDV